MGERLGELFERVIQREPDVEFLEDALRRLEMVGAYADPGNHDACAGRDPVDQLLEQSWRADAFEATVGRIGSCPSTAVGAAMREHAAATRINGRVLSAAESVPAAACAWLHSGSASLPIDRALIHIDSEVSKA